MDINKPKHLPRGIKQKFYNIVKPLKNKHVVVSFSGGADSSVLLSLINEYKKLFSDITVFHYNHKMRTNINGLDESSRDLEFSRSTAEKYGFKFISRDAESEILSEEDARNFRWESAASIGGDIVLTGHHKGDISENILLKILRGSGSKGVTGLSTFRSNGFVDICSPLTFLSKEEIFDLCENNAIDYVHDSSNDSSDYSRNHIRNIVMPAIEQRWPDASNKLLRFRDVLTTEMSALDSLLSEKIKHDNTKEWYINNLKGLPEDVQTNLIFKIMSNDNISTTYTEVKNIINIINKAGSSNTDFGNFSLVVRSHLFKFLTNS